MNTPASDTRRTASGSVAEVFVVFLRLGLTSFGGPVAHIGFFRHECVQRRRWLSDAAYADLVALCQFLPGPASSQVGMALGLMRAGRLGMLAAWLGFTLPSALALIALAVWLSHWQSPLATGALHGLKLVAVPRNLHISWIAGSSVNFINSLPESMLRSPTSIRRRPGDSLQISSINSRIGTSVGREDDSGTGNQRR